MGNFPWFVGKLGRSSSSLPFPINGVTAGSFGLHYSARNEHNRSKRNDLCLDHGVLPTLATLQLLVPNSRQATKLSHHFQSSVEVS